MTILFAAALTLSLAACGSDDDGGSGGGGSAAVSEPFELGDVAAVAAAIGPGTTPLTLAKPFDVDGEELTRTVTTDTAFTKSKTAAPAIEGWKGSAYTRSDEDGANTVATTVVSYTDIEDPTDAKYSDYYSAAAAASRVGVASATDAGVLTLDVGTISPEIAALFGVDVDDLTSGQENTLTGNARMREGSFHGVPGEFECTGSACSLTLGDDGGVSAAAGTWTFTPSGTVADIELKGAVPDADYLNLAAWVTSTTDKGGDVTYAIGALARGNRAGDYGSVAAVEGEASYTGPATGIYMRKTFSTHGDVSPAAAGPFVADASLSASFGGSTVGADNQFKISGTVDNFKDAAGREIPGDWELSLLGSGTDAAAAIDQSTGAFTGGRTEGSGSNDPGTWTGRFHGDRTGDPLPAAAAGTFTGHFQNGHVVGAFGASRVTEE